MRRNDVALTSFRRHVPTGFLINQCQIITFLILKSDIIENSRIELFCQYLQIKLKLHLLLFYPSTWYICVFFLFHIEIEGKCGWIIGGAKGYVGPPSQIIGGPGPPSSYAYGSRILLCCLHTKKSTCRELHITSLRMPQISVCAPCYRKLAPYDCVPWQGTIYFLSPCLLVALAPHFFFVSS